MSPEQKIKHAILVRAGAALPETVDAENIDELYAREENLYDVINEFREGEYETKIWTPISRNYETKSVAARMVDGSWVGWTYWYGGGKHGSPETIEWMSDAYDLTCVEEEKLVTVRTFTRV